MHASNRPVSEDEEENDVFSRRPLYWGCAGSDVIGCSGTGHADGVPQQRPLGDAVRSSHEVEMSFLPKNSKLNFKQNAIGLMFQ